ncbi:MAG: exosortase-associated EpsI family protein [Deltaproteobacteria bacterium]|nr:exosortase-associated EpsI family protein [Deltaproteobacteria bacterium]
MYRQQFYIIANFLMVLDTVIVIFTGYVAYSVTKRRTDGALVRLEMPLREGQDVGAAQAVIDAFITEFMPVLDDYIPGRDTGPRRKNIYRSPVPDEF